MASLGDGEQWPDAARTRSRGRDQIDALLDDLEQQAAGLALAERDDLVSELAEAAYVQIRLSARLHASIGEQVRLRLAGGLRIAGVLERVGVDFLVLDGGSARWAVPFAGVRCVDGLSRRARAPEVLPAVAKLGVTSVLRRLAEEENVCAFHDVDSIISTGCPVRVGADFVEIESDAGGWPHVVPLAAIAAIRLGR